MSDRPEATKHLEELEDLRAEALRTEKARQDLAAEFEAWKDEARSLVCKLHGELDQAQTDRNSWRRDYEHLKREVEQLASLCEPATQASGGPPETEAAASVAIPSEDLWQIAEHCDCIADILRGCGIDAYSIDVFDAGVARPYNWDLPDDWETYCLSGSDSEKAGGES